MARLWQVGGCIHSFGCAIPILILMASLPSVLCAQTRETKELARQYVAVSGYEPMVNAFRDQCLEAASKRKPEAALKRNPDWYGGIGPSSKHWVKIVKADEAYWRDYCSIVPSSDVLDTMASLYARELSVVELKAAIAFATTDLGRKLIATSIKGNEAFSSLAMRVQEKEGARLVEILDRRIREIIQEASVEKSCPSASEMQSNKALEARYPECVQGAARGR